MVNIIPKPLFLQFRSVENSWVGLDGGVGLLGERDTFIFGGVLVEVEIVK